jgi:mevalonate kinase
MATGSSVVFSAPGKVILFGEQVVVLGCTAIATALDLRTFVRIDVNGTDIVHLNLPDLNINTSWPVASLQYTGSHKLLLVI